MADTKSYIEKIRMPISGANKDLYVKDTEAVHAVKTINGDSIVGEGNVTLPNTKITDTEIDGLFVKNA